METFMRYLGELNETWFACHGLGAIQAQEKLSVYIEAYIRRAC